MSFKKLNEEIEKFLEEKYDNEMLQNDVNQKKEYYRKRNGGIARVYEFLSKLKEVKDLKVGKGTLPYITCHIPERAFTKFNAWNAEEGNILEQCFLTMKAENAEDGYRIIIQ